MYPVWDFMGWCKLVFILGINVILGVFSKEITVLKPDEWTDCKKFINRFGKIKEFGFFYINESVLTF